MSTQLSQIAKKAKLDRTVRFTSLAHLLTPEFLTETWGMMTRRAASGIDGESTEQFESELKQRVEEICAQLRAGAYRAPPVRRVEIPKGPGKTGTRPLGIPTVADRLYKPNVIAASAAQRVDQTKSDPAAGVEELPALVSGWLHDLAS
jgi:retron-type reverse transcriptase